MACFALRLITMFSIDRFLINYSHAAILHDQDMNRIDGMQIYRFLTKTRRWKKFNILHNVYEYRNRFIFIRCL